MNVRDGAGLKTLEVAGQDDRGKGRLRALTGQDIKPMYRRVRALNPIGRIGIVVRPIRLSGVSRHEEHPGHGGPRQ